MSWKNGDEVLHITAQAMWHDEVFITGTPEGLTRLRDAINHALRNAQRSFSASVFSADGEGYRAIVRCASGSKMDQVPFGYTDEMCRDDRRRPEWMTKDIAEAKR